MEPELAALRMDNKPTKFFRSLGVLKRERVAELIAQQLEGISLHAHGTFAYRQVPSSQSTFAQVSHVPHNHERQPEHIETTRASRWGARGDSRSAQNAKVLAQQRPGPA